MHLKVLITGANRGIGLAFAQQYTAAGHQVFAVCRKASEPLKALSNITIIEGVDVTSVRAAEAISAVLEDTTLDIVIQNAGILNHESIDNAPVEAIHQQFNVNALAPLQLTLGLLAHLSAGSKVALITSRMGSLADNTSGGYYGYRMSKAALNAAGVSLACDLKPKGIAVALLHPGFVQTEMVQHAGDISADEAAHRLRQRISELTLETSGTFWHSNGEVLPW